jgi:uncharacterized protein (TIGR00266 family)
MDFRIAHSPTFSILEIDLNQSESATAQPNSMLSMTSGITISANVGNSATGSKWFNGLKNLAGGENFFTARYTAKRDSQTVCLAPNSYGDIIPVPVDDEHQYFLTSGSYLANLGDVSLSVKYSGFKGWMSKKGLFLLSVQGSGTVFCQTYGAIITRDLAEEENFYVDNRFVVAFSQSIKYQLVKATESTRDSLLSGEGLVNRYTGPGRLYYQTRGKPSIGIFSRLLDAAF